MDFDIHYNGLTGKDMGVLIVERPKVPPPKEVINRYEVPGRDGALIDHTGNYEDIVISVDMGFRVKKEQWGEQFRRCRSWLLKDHTHKLRFSDDADFFYYVKYVEINDCERTIGKYGQFTVNFHCAGYQYAGCGEIEITFEDMMNFYGVSHPVYYITGEGVCTLLVNGNTFKVNVGQNAIIDSERMIAYRKDGTLMNTNVAGDYKDLWLIEGKNVLSATDGFTITLKPMWRHI